MKRFLMLAAPAVFVVGLLSACADTGAQDSGAAQGGGARLDGKTAVATVTPSKASATQPASGQASGTVTFKQAGEKVKVVADITGLTPNAKHGFHIHEKGDLSAPDLSSAGAHYNPLGHAHGGPTTSPVHAGDLGNLEADKEGKARLELTLDDISIGGKNDILGKPVIIHASPDDLKSQPAGNAGARVGGGLIELKK